MNRVFIALGSNIDKEQNLPRAAKLLRRICNVKAFSSVYETLPIGLSEQPNFFNAAVLVETDLEAAQFKEELLELVEKKLKRTRTADRNSPRTIDADIILFNDEVIEYQLSDGSHRQVPDPDLLRFPHVAVPIAELAPEMVHPLSAEPLASIARRLVEAAAGQGGHPLLWRRSDIVLA